MEAAESITKESKEIDTSDRLYLEKLSRVVDCIFETKSDTVEENFNIIKEYGHGFSFLTRCVEYALKVRPHQTESLCSLLKLISKNFGYTPSNELTNENWNSLFKNGVVSEDPYDIEYDEYPNGSIERAIIEDDVDTFVKLTNDPNFDPNQQIMTINKKYRNIYFVAKNAYRIYISYIDLMAFYGSVKCFKVSLCMKCFDLKNVKMYAIAGGNNEIIHLLEHEGVTFDNCYELSVRYHHKHISEWLQTYFNCEDFSPSNALLYYNIQYFLTNKKGSYVNNDFYNSVITNNLELVEHIYKIIHSDDIEISRTLEESCANGCFEVFMFLNELWHPEYDNFLYYAIIGNNFDLIKYLIKNSVRSSSDEYLLKDVIQNGNLEIFDYLVKEMKIDLKYIDEYETVLSVAVNNNMLKTTKHLIEDFHVDVEEIAKEMYHSVITDAYINNYVEIFEYLALEAHADFYNDRYLRPINYTETLNNKYIGLEKNTKVLYEKYLSIYYTIPNGTIQEVKKLLDENKNYAKLKYMGVSVFNSACSERNYDVVKYLVNECGINIEEKDSRGRTALQIAVEESNMNIVYYLIKECHANVETKDNYKITILHCAVSINNLDLVKYLIQERNLNVDDEDKEKETALNISCRKGNLDISKFLIEVCHANLNKDVLKCACKSRSLDLVRYLIEEVHIDFSFENFTGKNIYCINKSEDAELDEIITSDTFCDNANQFYNNLSSRINYVNPNFIEGDYDYSRFYELPALFNAPTMFHNALENIPKSKNDENPLYKYYNELISKFKGFEGNIEESLSLINEGKISVNQKCNGYTALHRAIRSGNLSSVKLLVNKYGADVNIKTSKQEDTMLTTLQLAIQSNSFDIVRFLTQECKVNVEEPDSNGLTPVYHAYVRKNNEIFDFLVKECHAKVDAKEIQKINEHPPNLYFYECILCAKSTSFGKKTYHPPF